MIFDIICTSLNKGTDPLSLSNTSEEAMLLNKLGNISSSEGYKHSFIPNQVLSTKQIIDFIHNML